MADMRAIADAVKAGRAKVVKQLVTEAVEQGATADQILNQALVVGMMELGELFKNNEVYVPEVLISARPEELHIHKADDGVKGIRARIDDSVFLGLNTHYFVTLETGEKAEVIQESQIDSILAPGTDIVLTVNMDKFNIFSKEDSRSLMTGIRNQLEEVQG